MLRVTPARRGHSVTVAGICLLIAAASASAQTGRPSSTALEVAAYRAIGAKHPDPSVRNGDRLAEQFLGPDERAILKESGSEFVLAALALDTERAWETLGNRAVLARAIHLRTRHIDEVMEESLKAGARQIVILGAGLDSRGYRYADLLRGARVFELDLPATQEYKKKRVRESLGSLPAHVTYVPIDFTKQDLASVLDAAGYDRKTKTLFIWEGVTMYIPEAAVDATLRFVAKNAASGSRVVFDYFLESALKAPTPTLGDARSRFASVGEPFVFGMPGDDAPSFVRARGLEPISDVGYSELAPRFLKGYSFPTRTVNRICTAAVR
jgi:methyltransferase (TIGR00027 family)